MTATENNALTEFTNSELGTGKDSVRCAAHGSPLALLREVLEKDRAAIAAMKKEAPWYVPDDEILDLHNRIESCLSANAELSDAAQSGAPETKL